MFYHPVLKFQFPIPSQWQVQNTPQAVQMAEPNGKAMMMMTLAQGNDLQSAAQTILQQYQLKVVDSGQETVNGMPAVVAVGDQVNEQGQTGARVLLYVIQYGQYMYAFLGASAPADFNGYGPLFKNTMTAFRQLDDQEKINRKPQRVRIKTVNQNTTLAQAFSSFNVDQKKMEEMAVLNGMMLNDRIEKGTLIKVVE